MLIGLSALTFLSCSEESLTGSQEMQPLSTTGNAMTTAEMQAQAKQMTQSPSPQEVSKAFFAMVDKAAAMSAAEIDSLNEEEVLELGKPILDATEGTITLAKTTLDELNDVLRPLAENIRNVSQKEHQAAGNQIKQIMASEATRRARSMESSQVRQILLKFQGEATRSSSTCEDLYDQWGGYVHLYSGDNLNIANSICPAGSMFWVHGGNYNAQKVENSKDGNFWLGVNGTVTLDGQGTTTVAFTGGMANNYFSWMEIKNYSEYGIYSESSSSTGIEIRNMTFRNIAGSKSSFNDGVAAIHFGFNSGVLIQDSFFNNVSQSIRFQDSNGTGHIHVLNNEALNTGFGFFQCNGCDSKGYDIKINDNSIEHTTKYGKDDLFDFISIYKSKGTANNYIQVNNNRARINLSGNNANGVSQFGCAILLGDEGGEYQEAVNNIGVNPGACGIGLAAGEHMYVSDNKMFSQAVQPEISNVGYYSANYSPGQSEPCRYHHYDPMSNSADWVCSNPDHCPPPYNNPADANGSCTDQNNSAITRLSLTNLIKDEALGAGIWDSW